MLGHNPHIVHCFAKIAKSLEIKEEVPINQRKTYVKRIKMSRISYFACIESGAPDKPCGGLCRC